MVSKMTSLKGQPAVSHEPPASAGNPHTGGREVCSCASSSNPEAARRGGNDRLRLYSITNMAKGVCAIHVIMYRRNPRPLSHARPITLIISTTDSKAVFANGCVTGDRAASCRRVVPGHLTEVHMVTRPMSIRRT